MPAEILMALVPCYECKAEISDQAKTCPQCGAKRPAKTRIWLLAVLILPAAFITWAVLRTPSVQQSAAGLDRETIAQCWKDQERKSSTPTEARSMASLCEGLESSYKGKYGRAP